MTCTIYGCPSSNVDDEKRLSCDGCKEEKAHASWPANTGGREADKYGVKVFCHKCFEEKVNK